MLITWKCGSHFLTQYKRTYTHPYEHTHAHPVSMSTPDRLIRHIMDLIFRPHKIFCKIILFIMNWFMFCSTCFFFSTNVVNCCVCVCVQERC